MIRGALIGTVIALAVALLLHTAGVDGLTMDVLGYLIGLTCGLAGTLLGIIRWGGI